jgi:hypothetical protein
MIVYFIAIICIYLTSLTLLGAGIVAYRQKNELNINSDDQSDFQNGNLYAVIGKIKGFNVILGSLILWIFASK